MTPSNINEADSKSENQELNLCPLGKLADINHHAADSFRKAAYSLSHYNALLEKRVAELKGLKSSVGIGPNGLNVILVLVPTVRILILIANACWILQTRDYIL